MEGRNLVSWQAILGTLALVVLGLLAWELRWVLLVPSVPRRWILRFLHPSQIATSAREESKWARRVPQKLPHSPLRRHPWPGSSPRP